MQTHTEKEEAVSDIGRTAIRKRKRRTMRTCPNGTHQFARKFSWGEPLDQITLRCSYCRLECILPIDAALLLVRKGGYGILPNE